MEKFIFVYNRLITLYKVTFQVTLEYFFVVAVIVTHSRRGQKIEFSNNFVASRSNVLLQNFYIHRGARVCYHICFAYQIDVTLSILSVRYYRKYASLLFFSLFPFIFQHSFFFAISNTCNFVDFKNDYVSITILKWNRRIDIPIFYTNFTFNVLESLRYILRITHSHVKEKFLCNVVIRELIEHESPSFRFF